MVRIAWCPGTVLHISVNPKHKCLTTFVAPWYADATELRGMAGLYDAIMPWTTFPDICTIRFEDLIGEKGQGSAFKQRETIKQIVAHLGMPYDDNQLDFVVQNIYGNAVTFRHGQIGSWKQCFTQTDSELLKQSMGQWLIDWGYETDLNW